MVERKSMTNPTPAPGWYPAPHANNEQRYWDGARWLEPDAPSPTVNTAALESVSATSSNEPGATAAANMPKKAPKKPLIIAGAVLAGIVLIGGVGAALGGDKKDDVAPVAESTRAASSEPAVEEEAEPEPVIVVVPNVVGMTARDAIVAIAAAGLSAPVISSFEDPDATVLTSTPAAGESVEEMTDVTFTVQEKPKLTLSQQNAVGQAKSYLAYSGFSRTGLIDQLAYEGYSAEDATFGADNAGADWNAECAEKAQSYLNYSTFSRQGLYDQLEYEGFLPTEIEFGLAAVGY